MESGLSVPDDARGLDELLEHHLQALFDKLARPHAIDDIQADLATLNDLLYSFKRRDELLENLLDDTTPEQKRRQIRETLTANRIKSAEDRLELEQLHARSHQLLERSMLLVMKAQWLIQKEAHNNSGYRLKSCAECEGSGRSAEGRCPSCKGTGQVVSRQPKPDSL